MSIESICKSIYQPSPMLTQSSKIIEWRDENPGTIRKVAAGAALAGSALLSVVDTIISLALVVLTFPLKLGGITLADAFYARAAVNILIGGTLLTYDQYDNATAVNLAKTGLEKSKARVEWLSSLFTLVAKHCCLDAYI